MATDERKNIVNEENEQAEDSGVFDIFFIQNEDGEVVVTTENPSKEAEDSEEFLSLDNNSENVGTAEVPEIKESAEISEAPETTDTEKEAEPIEREIPGEQNENLDEDLDSDDTDVACAVEAAALDGDTDGFEEEFDETLENDEEDALNIPKEDEAAADPNTPSSFEDPFDNPLGAPKDSSEIDKEAELFGEELDAEIQSLDNDSNRDEVFFEPAGDFAEKEFRESAEATAGRLTDDVVVTSIEETSDEISDATTGEAFGEEDEKPASEARNEKEVPSALEKLKQSIEKINERDRWRDSDANGKNESKTVLGIDYKVWAIIISAIFTLDAILANVVCHWGIYFIVDKLLKLSGVAALKLEAESYQSFSVVISYVVSFILGGFVMFLLMSITKRLLNSVEFREGAALIKVVLGILTAIFAIGAFITVVSGHAFATFECCRFASPLFMYIGALLFYALSNIKFNQDY